MYKVSGGIHQVLSYSLNVPVRYWGKRDTRLILPTNSSLSVTLDQDHLRSTTTSRADPSFTEDILWLNGQQEVIKPGGRTATCISELKKLRKALEDKDNTEPKVCSGLVS
jgi:diphosphomevalonate decarboxylase